MRHHQPVVIVLLAFTGLLAFCGGPPTPDRTPGEGTVPPETPGATLPAPTAQPTEIGLCPPSSPRPGDALWPTHPPTLTLADFAFLKPGMRATLVEQRVGPPDRLVPSGRVIVQYRLAGGGIVELAYGNSGMRAQLAHASFFCPDGSGVIVLVDWK